MRYKCKLCCILYFVLYLIACHTATLPPKWLSSGTEDYDDDDDDDDDSPQCKHRKGNIVGGL